MRRDPVHNAADRAARSGLALVVSLALVGLPAPAHARAPALGTPPLLDIPAQPTSAGPLMPVRTVLVDLRFAPERRLGDARIRITPMQGGLPPAIERPIFGPTMTLSLPPGSYSLEVTAPRHSARVDLQVRPGMPPVEVKLERRSGGDAPRFRNDKRLVGGLAGVALLQLFGGTGLLIVGAAREGAASRRNEDLLMKGLVDAAAPEPGQPTGLALVEAEYSTARYHRDLSRAMTLEVAGAAVAMAGIGAGLAAMPIVDQNRLRAAYIEMGIGAVMTAGGAACLTVFVRDRASLLAATDPTERVTTSDLRSLNGTSIGGAMLTGLGIGMVVYPAIALLTNAVKGRRDRNNTSRLAPYMAPGQAGISFQGRF